MAYLSKDELRQAFIEYLEKYQNCSHTDALIAASDFPDPYSLPYHKEEYLGEETIEGEKYEQNASWLDFSMFRTFSNNPVFRFYTYYRLEDVQDHLVKHYMSAKTLYELVPVGEENDDFPEISDEEESFCFGF